MPLSKLQQYLFLQNQKFIIIFVLYNLINTNSVTLKNKEKISELLHSWENTYKKGQLTLWIFMALQENNKYVDEIKDFINQKSAGTISCEEQSLYRALRKYEHLQILSFEKRAGNKGPDRKYYFLTALGQEIFNRFVNRNIKLFYSEEIRNLLNL